MNPRVSYGDGVPDDTTLRLCGDLPEGRRALELGISDAFNALAFAEAGAKAIAVDPDPERIADLRARAVGAEVSIECHGADLADLGFATSGSIELAVANHTLDAASDPGRVLRQVNRVLKQSAPLVIAVEHPFAAVSRDESKRYGAGALTVERLVRAAQPGQLPRRHDARARRRRRITGARRPSSSAPAKKAPEPRRRRAPVAGRDSRATQPRPVTTRDSRAGRRVQEEVLTSLTNSVSSSGVCSPVARATTFPSAPTSTSNGKEGRPNACPAE